MKISIRQHTFTVRSTYSEGTVLTKAEAQALNGLRAENIRNNISRAVLTALADRTVLTAEEHRELQELVTEYDLKYQFQQKVDRGGQGKSPVEAEALAVATETVEAHLRQTGQVISAREYEQALAAALATPEVQATARKRVVLAQEAAKRALEELL
jgi:hypothetical protein